MTSDPTIDHDRPTRPACARRCDPGTVRCSGRDLELLRIVGEQYAMTLPQLARMMACSSRAARWLRSRWGRAGWARGRALLVGEPVFVWLTRRGHSLAGIDYSVWRPNAGMLAHIAAVTDVRLHVPDRHPGTWVCERELHRELEALLRAAPATDLGRVDRLMWLTAAMTGLRQGELLALRWRDVDWLAGRLRVRRSFVHGEFGTPKSHLSSRSVPPADRVATELDAHHRGTAYSADDDLVFGHPHLGTPLSRCARFRNGWATATTRRR